MIKRKFFLMGVLCLFLIVPLISIVGINENIIYFSNSDPHMIAADGDESIDSITSFSETLPNNVKFYADGGAEESIVFASAGDAFGPQYTYVKTQTKDGSSYRSYDGTGPYVAWMYLNFSFSSIPERIRINNFGRGAPLSVDVNIFSVYDGTSFVDLQNLPLSLTTDSWRNFTLTDSKYWSTDNKVLIYFRIEASSAPYAYVWCDYLEVVGYYPSLSDSTNHYVESFTDISDWTLSTGNAPTTDGDKMTWAIDGDNLYDDIYSNAPNYGVGVSFGQYLEFSAWTNDATDNTLTLRVWAYSGNSQGSTWWQIGIWSLSETPTTYKIRITSSLAESGAFECVEINAKSSTSAANVYMEYLRISPANETGWQNDGGDTNGVVAEGGGSVSSDSEYLSLIGDSDGSTFNLTMDDTASVAVLNPSYYPMLVLAFHSGDSEDYVKIEAYDGTDLIEVWENNTIGTDPIYCNWESVISRVSYIRISVSSSQTIRLNYAKAFSIANWTYSANAITTNDYVFLLSNIIYSSVDSGSIVFNYDSELSVNTATFNIFNITTISTSPAFAYYVSAWSEFTTDTRGKFASGTLTDLKLNFTTDGSLSAIKFIEDGTSPIILDMWINPPQPSDAEPVTFTVITSDTVNVYKVTINALIYPSGFTDIDYDMNVFEPDVSWTFTFGSLTAGYYFFVITATDGANNDTVNLPLTVGETGISLVPISFIGAGPDFTGVQFSFDCNRAGSFSVTEWTAINETHATDAAETHTGTIINGLNNIFWAKLTTDVLTVYFNFTITSGTLETNWTSNYQVAQITFDVVLSDKFVDFDRVFIEGESTKAASYQIYDASGILRDSGNIPEGSFALNFEMWNKRSLTDHAYGIKFINGSSIDWINGSYYADSPDQYKGGGVTTGVVPWWQDPMTWVLIGGGLALVFVFTSGSKFGKLPDAKKEFGS